MFDNNYLQDDTPHRPPTTRLRALLRGLCPRCRMGKIFARGLQMHERCPVCEMKFEREQGYFLGAMGISYILGLGVLALLLLILSYGVFPDWPAYKTILPALVVYLPLLPFITRSARIIWIHLDRTIDPV